MIVRVWQRVAGMRVADEVVVATDSEEVAAVIRECGGRVAITREDHASGTDRVAEVAGHPGFEDFDVIVNVQGDEPFIRDDAVSGALSLVQSGRFLLGTAAACADARILDRPDTVKVVLADDGRALYFSRAPIPYLRDDRDRPLRDAAVRLHIGVYACRRDALRTWVSLPPHALEKIERLEQLRPLAAGLAMGVHVLDAPPHGGIDTEEDLIRANSLWNDLYAGRT